MSEATYKATCIWYKVLLPRKGEGKKGRRQKKLRNSIFHKTCTQEKSKHNSLKLAKQGDGAENLRGVAFITQKNSTKFFQDTVPSDTLRGGGGGGSALIENNVVLLNSAPSCSEINFDFLSWSATQAIPIATIGHSLVTCMWFTLTSQFSKTSTNLNHGTVKIYYI